MKIPATRPHWTKGEHAVYQGEELLGYFLRFDSAHRWIQYLRSTDDTSRFSVVYKGRTLYINNPSTGALLP